jgi:hypothetical protein
MSYFIQRNFYLLRWSIENVKEYASTFYNSGFLKVEDRCSIISMWIHLQILLLNFSLTNSYKNNNRERKKKGKAFSLVIRCSSKMPKHFLVLNSPFVQESYISIREPFALPKKSMINKWKIDFSCLRKLVRLYHFDICLILLVYNDQV